MCSFEMLILHIMASLALTLARDFPFTLSVILSLTISRSLTVGGVREIDLAAEHFPVERREAVGCFRVNQAEEIQLVNMQVTDGLHLR